MKLNHHPRSGELVYELADAVAIDGDTIQARIILGFGTSLIRRIRLKGFYAAELNGDRPEQGAIARQRLQDCLQSGTLTIAARGSKDDLHGRLCAVLSRDGIALNPHEVLGPWQLTEQEHAQDLKAAKHRRAGRGVLL